MSKKEGGNVNEVKLEDSKKPFSGGLFGSYPPKKYDSRLHEDIEVEEYYKEEEDMEKNPVLDRYIERKEKYVKKILGELEAFTEKRAEEWTENEEGMIWDILDKMNNEIKSQMSRNIPNYEG